MIWRKSLNRAERKIVDTVARTGCHINVVWDPDSDGSAWAYSVGFPETVDQPEVIVIGLDGQLMGAMINDTMQLCKNGLTLSDGVEIDSLLQDHVVVVRSVPTENIVPDYLNSAIWYEKRRTGQALSRVVQLVWPDLNGRYPWDADCDAAVMKAQPALYERSLNS
ncbi:DUF4262 domain-containing protein [Sphingosinithalassobacter portus]|uniref:DUF4262 domain-containing protein n=1 Tax=Stakelama portus TaxID=2676234 RepID=UPI0013798A3F|nr:DUF4262 domain-containing protein [Sphingosinithalassobacter portus]